LDWLSEGPLAKYVPSESEIFDLLFDELESIFIKNGQQISSYNLPRKSKLQQIDITNRLIQEEINYDTKYLQKEANKLYSQLNTEQRHAFHEIINMLEYKSCNHNRVRV
jgi:hypothetical protein